MKLKTIAKRMCGLIAVVVLSACSGNGMEGKWVEPVPGMENQMQGVQLEKGGKASSINMATLQYERWERKGDKLILSGKSIGNHETIPFTDTLAIEKLTDNELTLKKGSLTFTYQKQ